MADFIISDIKFKRSVLYCSGIFEGIDKENIEKFVFQEKETKEEIEIEKVELEDNTFSFRFYVLAALNEYPIPSGEWYLVLKTKNTEDMFAHVDKIVYDKVHLAKFDGDKVDAIFDKSASNYFHGYSRINSKYKTYFLLVDYVIPVSTSNVFIKWIKSVRKYFIKKLRKLRKFGFRLFFNFFNKVIEKNGKRILFTSSSRAEIGGNEKFVYDRMVERNMVKDYEIRFDYKESIDSYRSIINKFKFTYYLATSDYIFLDDYQPEIYKNDYDEEVKIIQLWHACGAFKTLGFERLGAKGAPGFTTRVHKCYTHVPVSSDHSKLHHAEAFGISEDKFYPIGIARTDIFFDEDYIKRTKEKIYNHIPELKEASKVILYAPTFRGNNAKDAFFPIHMIDFKKLGKYLEKVNGVMLIKMHPFVDTEINIPEKYKKYFINASSEREVNDLLMVTDVLITDYSSVIYEMSLLKKPMIFYAFDIDTYETSRGFFEPYKDIVPGEIVKSIDHLIDVLEADNYDYDKLEKFLKKNFKYTDGKSTDRVIDLIFNDVVSK